MLTPSEKGYLVLTLCFLAAGSGIKAWRHVHVKLGPFPDPDAAPAEVLEGPVGSDSSRIDPLASAKVNDSSSFASDSGAASDPVGRKSPGSPQGRDGGKSAFTGKVDLNRAPASDLTHVKGIGEKTAEAIVQYRRSHGPFRDLRDLLQVKGIGEKKLEKLTPYLIL